MHLRELRLFTELDDVESVNQSVIELLRLCDQTVSEIESAIGQLESEAIASFCSFLQRCKPVLARAQSRLADIPVGDESRCGPLREIIQELRSLKKELADSWAILERHSLDQGFAEPHALIITGLRLSRKRYLDIELQFLFIQLYA
jgi:hypothetical protein